MKNTLHINDLYDEKEQFWTFFFSRCYPNGYFEEKDIELSEYIREKYNVELKWADDFTKYYEGVLDIEDGYVENPRKVIVDLAHNNLLEVEFHPGDTIFYLNKEVIGCTGPHFSLHKIPWPELKNLLVNTDNVEWKFFLILPMVFVKQDEIDESLKIITQYLNKLPFELEDHEIINKCIIENILKN